MAPKSKAGAKAKAKADIKAKPDAKAKADPKAKAKAEAKAEAKAKAKEKERPEAKVADSKAKAKAEVKVKEKAEVKAEEARKDTKEEKAPEDTKKRKAESEEDGPRKEAKTEASSTAAASGDEKEKEKDAPADSRAAVKVPITFEPLDTTLNAVPTMGGKVLMALTDGGMQHLVAGARASLGVKKGRYLYEARIVESIVPSDNMSSRRGPAPKQLVRLGFSLEGSDLLMTDSKGSVYFDAEGVFAAKGRKTSGGQRFGRDQVIGVLLNVDQKSPNANTISLFRDGVRISEPQALPDELVGKPLYPHVSYRNVSLQVNFGPHLLAELPFKCRTLQGAAQDDVKAMASSKPKNGLYDVVLPVGLPDEGVFDWLDEFLDENPSFVELSDRKIIEWAKKSGMMRPVTMSKAAEGRHSNDKPEFASGIPTLDDFSARQIINTIATMVPRHYVVMEMKANLLPENRAETLKRFPATKYRRKAIVVVGEPDDEFRTKQHEFMLKAKQEREVQEWKKRKEERERKKQQEARVKAVVELRKQAEERRKKYIEEAKKKAEEARKKKEEEEKAKKAREEEERKKTEDAKKAEDAKEAEAGEDGSGENAEAADGEEPKEEGADEEMKEEPEGDELADEPEDGAKDDAKDDEQEETKEEAKEDVKEDAKEEETEASKEEVKEEDKKEDKEDANEEVEDKKDEEVEEEETEPPEVELTEEEKKKHFRQHPFSDLAPTALSASYAKFSLPKKDEGFQLIEFAWSGEKDCVAYFKKWQRDKKFSCRIEDLKPSAWFQEKATEWQKVLKEWNAKQKSFKAKVKEAKAGTKKEGEDEEENKEEEDADMDEDDDDGVDIFTVEDVTDVGNGEPLFKEFSFEDWVLVQLRCELYLLVKAFLKDVDDVERTGVALKHLEFYYNKYFGRNLVSKAFGYESLSELLAPLKDTVVIKSGSDGEDRDTVELALEDVETLDAFVKFSEGQRRERQRRIDAGDETAKLKFANDCMAKRPAPAAVVPTVPRPTVGATPRPVGMYGTPRPVGTTSSMQGRPLGLSAWGGARPVGQQWARPQWPQNSSWSKGW